VLPALVDGSQAEFDAPPNGAAQSDLLLQLQSMAVLLGQMPEEGVGLSSNAAGGACCVSATAAVAAGGIAAAVAGRGALVYQGSRRRRMQGLRCCCRCCRVAEVGRSGAGAVREHSRYHSRGKAQAATPVMPVAASRRSRGFGAAQVVSRGPGWPALMPVALLALTGWVGQGLGQGEVSSRGLAEAAAA
jgi:hypothetical protein